MNLQSFGVFVFFLTGVSAYAALPQYCKILEKLNDQTSLSQTLIHKINTEKKAKGLPPIYPHIEETVGRSGVIKGRASEADSVNDWITKGVNITAAAPNNLKALRSLFMKAATDRTLGPFGVFNKSKVIYNPEYADNAIRFWFMKRPISEIDQEIRKIEGFTPTPENFEKVHYILSKLKEVKLDYTLPPYETISELKPFPSKLPIEYRDFYSGIVSFWNSPSALLSKIRYLKQLIKKIRASEANMSDEKALEKIRKFYEKKNGFSDHITPQNDILNADQWYDFLLDGEPSVESNGAHSYGLQKFEAQNVHRNQWLLIMLEIELNPSRFGRGQTLLASEAYKELGRLGSLERLHPDWKNLVLSEGESDASGYSYWTRLFDFVYYTSSDSLGVANAANPLYFNELWMKATGFRSEW